MSSSWIEIANSGGAERNREGIALAFGDVVAETRVARQGTALFDLTPRARIEIVGPNARKLLHGQVTNDILALDAGAGCYAAHLTAKGRMICDMVVRCDAEDRCTIEVDRAAAANLTPRFTRFAMLDDCEVADISDAHDVLLLTGPTAGATLAKVLEDEAFLDLPPYHHVSSSFDGHDTRIQARADLGEPGYAVTIDRAFGGHLAATLLGAGAALAGQRAFELLTIEAGTPIWGRDMSDANLPPECGIPHAISYTKGCYVGQETVARIRTYGQVNKELRGLASETPLPVGAELMTRDEKEVGTITASGISPNLNRPVALGYVHRSAMEPGQRLLARTASGVIEVEVVALPFVERRVWPATPE